MTQEPKSKVFHYNHLNSIQKIFDQPALFAVRTIDQTNYNPNQQTSAPVALIPKPCYESMQEEIQVQTTRRHRGGKIKWGLIDAMANIITGQTIVPQLSQNSQTSVLPVNFSCIHENKFRSFCSTIGLLTQNNILGLNNQGTHNYQSGNQHNIHSGSIFQIIPLRGYVP